MMADELDAMPPPPPWDPEVRSATKELPASPAAERALIGSVLISGALLPAISEMLSAEDMAAEGHRLIFSACLRVHAAGASCDLLTVEEDLAANGQLERAGGAGYLASLLDVVPDVDNARGYARLVREAAIKRRAMLAARNVASGLGSSESLRESLVGALKDLDELDRGVVKASPWLTYGDVLSKAKSAADRIPTGLEELDRLIDGGLHAGSVTVVQGKPGVGKTLLATQIALGLAKKCFVAALYADEGLRGASITIGQQLGVEKRALERCFQAALLSARESLATEAPHWSFLDPMHKRSTLEYLAEGSAERAAKLGIPLVWLIDSVQVLRSSVLVPRMTLSDRISALMIQIRDLAMAHGAIALVCSKVNRSSYRNKEEAANSEDLSAGLGSADIEFMSELVLHIRGNPQVSPVVKAAKNRLSAEGEFEIPLKLDRDRKRYVALSVAVLEQEHEAKRQAVDIAMDDEIIAFIRKNPNCSGSYIRTGVRGKDTAIMAALKRLVAGGRLFHQQGARSAILYTVPNTPGLHKEAE